MGGRVIIFSDEVLPVNSVTFNKFYNMGEIK